MLVLSTFRRLLSQVLTDDNDIHTAVLATPTGNLVSYASKREVDETKTEIRTLVGLACEIWADEEKEESVMAETEVRSEWESRPVNCIILKLCPYADWQVFRSDRPVIRTSERLPGRPIALIVS